MKNIANSMRESLKDALAKGYTRDATDLAALATISGRREDVTSELVILASDVLNEAGYCECGVKFSAYFRCLSCGRLLPKERNA